MKIVKFTGENFKRLKAVEITPDGNTVVISGRNAQGKTSVLDAIWAAVGGKAATKATPRPVRDGEESATVSLDLGGMIVTRTWDDVGKTKLTVTSPEGARFPSPQKLLDELVGQLAFDPLAFAAMPEKDQRAALLDLVDLPFNVDELDATRQAAFDKRTDVNREVKRLTAVLGDMPKADESAQPVDVVALMAELAAAQRDAAQKEIDATKARRLEEDLKFAEQQLAEMTAKVADLRAMQSELAEPQPADPFAPSAADIASIEQRIAQADAVNAAVRANEERAKVEAELERVTTRADQLSTELAEIDATKAEGLAKADMPIHGLGIDDTGVTYQGVPFAQASAAERLKVSMAIAMAANPGLRVIRITDGSLLDSSNMALIEAMAADGDYQVWIEVVDETGQLGVMIEDGQVAS